jgi:hypothetical protein
MFNKKAKPYTELLGKTNRIVEGTIIKGDMYPKLILGLTEVIGNFFLLGSDWSCWNYHGRYSM